MNQDLKNFLMNAHALRDSFVVVGEQTCMLLDAYDKNLRFYKGLSDNKKQTIQGLMVLSKLDPDAKILSFLLFMKTHNRSALLPAPDTLTFDSDISIEKRQKAISQFSEIEAEYKMLAAKLNLLYAQTSKIANIVPTQKDVTSFEVIEADDHITFKFYGLDKCLTKVSEITLNK